MWEIHRRLREYPLVYAECVLATLILNALALADTLFVMLVLRRYIAGGVDGTLLILSAAVLFSLIPVFGLREARRVLTGRIQQKHSNTLSQKLSQAFRCFPAGLAGSMGEADMRARWADFSLLRNAYGPRQSAAVLDAPFAVIFAGVVFLLHPYLGVVVGLGLLAHCIVYLRNSTETEEHRVVEEPAALLGSVMADQDTAKLFGGGSFQERFHKAVEAQQTQGAKSAGKEQPTAAKIVGACSKVAVYGVGAKLVVMGELSVAALIGVSLMAVYAERKLLGLLQLLPMFRKARKAKTLLQEIISHTGSNEDVQLQDEIGFAFTSICCTDVGFAHGGGLPVLEGITLDILPGGITAVTGPNGSGKTTLLRLLLGLLVPTEGSVRLVLENGRELDVGELSAADRARIFRYLPQEPLFLGRSIGENITLGNDEPGDAGLADTLARAGLKDFVEAAPKGLDTQISSTGAELPPGLRRRVALASMIHRKGGIVVMDEPAEAMDEVGAAHVYAYLNELARDGATIIVAGNDPRIVKAAHKVVELGGETSLRLARGGENVSAGAVQ